MFNIVAKRKLFLIIAAAFVLISLVSLLLFGLKLGVELDSGSILTIKFDKPVEQADLQQEIDDVGYTGAIVQRTSTGSFIIRTHDITDVQKVGLEEILEERFGTLTEVEFNSVSPMVATETARNAVIAVAVAAVGILLYMTWAFRRMPSPFLYGTCAIIALIHDSLIAVGVFSILGAVLNWEINLMFITGVLAVIGYSVNNTVVIFDRIRENRLRGVSRDFSVVVNNSLVETLSRSLNTGITTLIVVVALLVFVGSTIQNFSVVLLTGVIAGTYSSIFVAPLLLEMWEGHRRNNKF